jgi:hypothetical protein
VRMRVRVSVRCRHVVRCVWEMKRINIARTETQMFVVCRAGVSRELVSPCCRFPVGSAPLLPPPRPDALFPDRTVVPRGVDGGAAPCVLVMDPPIPRGDTLMYVSCLFGLSAGDACPVLAADPERSRPGVARFSFAFMFILMFVRSLLGSRSVVVRWMFRFCTVVIRVFLGVWFELVRFSFCVLGLLVLCMLCAWSVLGRYLVGT